MRGSHRSALLRAAALVAVVALGACGSSSKHADSSAPGSTASKLRNADDVLNDRDNARAINASLGGQVKLGDVRITVSAIDPFPGFNPKGTWERAFNVKVRSENPTDQDQQNPDVSVHCDGQ